MLCRCDKGGENVKVGQFMLTYRGINIEVVSLLGAQFITKGKSVFGGMFTMVP